MKLSRDALFKELRALIFRGLADHEIGHTVGLRHNFAASSDALNYQRRVLEDPDDGPGHARRGNRSTS